MGVGGGCDCIYVRADNAIFRWGTNQIKYSFGANTASSKFWPQCRKKNTQKNAVSNKTLLHSFCLSFPADFLLSAELNAPRYKALDKNINRKRKKEKNEEKEKTKTNREVFLIALSRRIPTVISDRTENVRRNRLFVCVYDRNSH